MSDAALDVVLARLSRTPDHRPSWEELYRQTHPLVFATLFRLTNGDVERAEDLAHDVFLRVARYRPFARMSSTDAFKRYLRTICHNVLRDRFRHDEMRWFEQLSTEEHALHAVAHERTSEIVEAADLHDHLMSGLEPQERGLFKLLLSGATYEEIGRALGILTVSARVRALRLRKKLERVLKEPPS